FIESSKFDTRKVEMFANSERKIIVDAVEDNNDDIYYEVFEFFLSIQSKTSQRIVSNNTGNNFNHSINKLNDSTMDIQNPIEQQSRGRPKSSSKRIKNVLEKPNTKPKNKCRICKQKGHNSKT
ncbi:21139_t:CDS:2, partial [Gigaspora rosea]